ncbi:MAG TPA: DNA repair exonuclease, partial [Firmicutes bacterium]|nr:DNA repair exonuclease [Bacillota bacterium]
MLSFQRYSSLFARVIPALWQEFATAGTYIGQGEKLFGGIFMGGIRFIHTADIHLGSVLETGDGPLPDSMQELVTSATFEGFRRVCSLAIEHAVDFVVIAGDLYDRRARSVHAQEFFVAQCLRLQAAGIGVYVLAGNHDPLRQKNELFEPPANVFIFSAEAPQVFTAADRRGKAA